MAWLELALDVFCNANALRPDPFRSVSVDPRLLKMKICVLGLNSESEACCALRCVRPDLLSA